MPDLLLKTKLSTPLTRQHLVSRPRLIEQLNAGLWQPPGFARKLTLVSAPAGYGKTTLVAGWLRSLAVGCAWLSLDEGDNDPNRFLAYLLAALRQVDERIGATAQAMLQSPQPPASEIMVTSLLHDLEAAPAPCLLALDDYHAIHNPSIHRQLAFLLEHQPACLHLVLLTREDPLLPIARLRSQGQVCEVRQEHLRFNPTETAGLLCERIGLHLDQEDLDTLQNRTEGWVAGLHLAALSMRGHPDLHEFVRSFAGSNRYTLDYLFEEIFSRQPAEMQAFLVKTSILDRLSGGLCDAVVGPDEAAKSQGRLEALERANLFIVPLDPSGEWYRYHHLFQELLRHQLHVRGDLPEKELHRRASSWYAAGGHLHAAIQHALAAQDWGAAARLIGRASESMLKSGEIATLVGWYRALPGEAACADPALCLAFAWALLLAGQSDSAAGLLGHAEGLAQPGSPTMGQVAAAQAYLARSLGDSPLLIEKSRQALAWLPPADLVSRGNVALNLGIAQWHTGELAEAEAALHEAEELSSRIGNAYALFAAQIFLARIQASRGKLRQAAAMYQKVLQDGGDNPILALAFYDLGAIYYEWNDLPKASEAIQRGLEMSTRSGNVEFQNSGLLLRVFLALAQKDYSGAREAVEQAHVLARGLPEASRRRSAACHARLALAQGDLEAAEHWAGQAGDDVDAHPFYRFLGLTRAHLLLARGQKQAAVDDLAARYDIARQSGWGYAAIAVRVLQALAAGSTETALDHLAEALRLGQPEGFLRTFAGAGEKLRPLLHAEAVRGVAPEHVGRILAAIPQAETRLPAGLVEPLSERELEVLRLVAAGFSNREIAAKLFISPGTAKTHLHNICGKLGVRNRTEAASRALELKLV